ncbi:pyruvate dehydrogenase phosphatase regulatory subunit [Mytilus galloprovincialis]|uniref:Pyruvate dehydrogenase phosphatase regulatory subunit n=2 Tax=Mytilus galloprovincialis TaxID=29158 RepID=A0A8B6DJK7_MYTGA|nr:pyruvate dehydrogenase phosphatase regulatory subunit [Mytilus galloprovincialis]VDI20062.1 pyruvate dehydrogenase phosphatase regulatory subunit [Mytilus galloprovincialis]
MSLIRYLKVPLHKRCTSDAFYRAFHRSCINNNEASKSLKTVVDLPKHARVVICGGGVTGSSIAYHLAERGWNDVVLLEQGKYTCGTTWHSVGLIGQLRDDVPSARLVKYSAELYRSLEKAGHGIGWKQCGSINIAQTKDRVNLLQRKHAVAVATGIEAHFIGPKEVQRLAPVLKTEDIEAALYVPSDGVVAPSDLASTYVRLAKDRGVKMFEGVQVEKILTHNGHVHAVQTSLGTINCEYFVNCGGLWSRQIGKKSQPRVQVPLHATEHFYIVTKEVPGVDSTLPVIRDYDGLIYYREWSGGVMAGGFEPVAKPVFHTNIPDKFEFQLLPEDWDHFQILLDAILNRMPAVETAEVRQFVNGPESFTPDGSWILGESAEIGKYFVAAGMSSTGVVASGGVGKHIAEWIIDGEPSINLEAHDILRFVSFHNNRRFLRERVKESLGMYRMKYPGQQWKTGRNFRTSPLYTRLKAEGACFGETNAYERPMYFNDTADTKGKSRIRMDLSQGSEALDLLQYLSSNDINQPIGTVIHTGMQNNRGGYENDCSIVPLTDNRFFMIAPTSQQTRSFSWLRKHCPLDGSVMISDLTSAFSGLNVVGPHAQQLLADVTDTSMTLNDFKPMTCQVIDVGYAGGIIAMRLTHAGEDGFVLYVPSEYSLHVYDTLMKAGKDYGIRNAGYYAMRKLRIEKFFAFWGQDLSTDDTPFECGRDFRVKLNKGDFIGRDALVKQKENGISQKFVQFLLKDFDTDNDVWPWGGEPIYRNGKFAGTVTSSAYGPTLEKMICLGFVRDYDENDNRIIHKNINQFIMDKDANYEVVVGGQRFQAEARLYTTKEAYTSSDPVFIPVPKK